MRRARAVERAAASTTAPAHAHDLGNARSTWARQGEVATSFWRRELDWRGLVLRHTFSVAIWPVEIEVAA